VPQLVRSDDAQRDHYRLTTNPPPVGYWQIWRSEMQQKQLAEFYGVTDRAVRKWSDEKTNRKTIQAEADVTPLEWQLVGEIAQLVYTYNAKGWEGCNITTWASLDMNSHRIAVSVYTETGARNMTAATSDTAEMQLIKMQLEKLVYGEEK